MKTPSSSRSGTSVPRPLTAQIEVRDERALERDHGDQAMRLVLRELRRGRRKDGVEPLVFETDDGAFEGRYHSVEKPEGRPWRAAIWVGGAGGGLEGPARGLYPAACARLQSRGLAGLRIDYRFPNDLPACILDTLLGVAFLQAEGVERVALVGHSFGGAVVISAGALSTEVTAVVPMSTQTYGADLAADVSPRPLLLIHGQADEILPSACSELVYAAAREPKELKLFPGARHGLDSVREDVLDLLVEWLDRNT